MSAFKKVFSLLIVLVGLFIFSVITFDYYALLDGKNRDNTQASTLEKYIIKVIDLKEAVISKIDIFGGDSNSKNLPIDLQLIKKDGVVILNGVFKNEKQAQEVADLLNVNSLGEYIFKENRVKDVVLLNKLSSLMIPFKDFFDNDSKLYVEDGQVFLNGRLKDSNYRALFDSILAKSKLEIISYIKEPTVIEAQEIVENEKIKEMTSLADNEEKSDLKKTTEIKPTVVQEIEENVETEILVESKTIEELQAEINSILAKNKINFKRRSTSITKESFSSVKDIAQILKDNPTIKVEIAGHTDSRGKASLNKRISQDRANSVKKELISLGVSKDNLKAVGYGEDFPIAKDDKNGLSEINRRVEFNILGD